MAGKVSQVTVINLQKSIREEQLAARAYYSRAKVARHAGDTVSAKLWEHIAGEEVIHSHQYERRLHQVKAILGKRK